MADKTNIEWCDATWNPLRGCSRVSEGCRNCYAESVAARFSGPGLPYHGLAKLDASGNRRWTGKVDIVEHLIDQPLRWKKPRRIFVNSMSDLFHENVPSMWTDRIFAVMALAPQHTFQILTKRPERMQSYMRALWTLDRIRNEMDKIKPQPPTNMTWPLPNVWLGVSVENQATADERVPLLLQTPAAKRFISAEPLLGVVNLYAIPFGEGEMDALNPYTWASEVETWRDSSDTWEKDFLEWFNLSEIPTTGNLHHILDWVICGGESGPNARPMHPAWARILRDQCAAAGVPFFFKQWGVYAPLGCFITAATGKYVSGALISGNENWHAVNRIVDGLAYGECVERLGKRAAGSLLDDIEHKEFPV